MFEAHFQSFEDRSERAESAPRVAALRAELAKRGLDGLVVPRADRFQNEYVPPCAEQLAWLTGFTGSAGIAIVLTDRAVIFVDGRYQVQVQEEIDGTIFSVAHVVENPPTLWIENNLPAGAKLGYSPWLHTVEGAERFAKACAAARAMLVPVEDNPIDAVWTDRPQPPLGAVVPHDLRYAGEATADKLKRLHTEMEKISADALVVSDPQNVSWLFNIRGSDVPHTPVVLAFATVPMKVVRRSMSTCASSATICAPASKKSPSCAPTPPSSAIWPSSARSIAPCGSIPRPAPRRSRASSSRTAARSCAAAIRSRR